MAWLWKYGLLKNVENTNDVKATLYALLLFSTVSLLKVVKITIWNICYYNEHLRQNYVSISGKKKILAH